jgi:general secretion pathway protein M
MRELPAALKELPEGARGQVLAVAVAFLGLGLVYLLVVSPVLGFYNDRAEQLDRRVTMASRYEALARQLPALKAGDKQWRDRSGGEMLLDGTSDALASAALQTVIKGLVDDAGAKLSSSEILAPADEGGFRRVGIRVVFSGDLKLVTAVLHGVETSRPILSVGDFSLHGGSAAGGGESSDSDEDASPAAGGGDGALSVTLDVYGFRAA